MNTNLETHLDAAIARRESYLDQWALEKSNCYRVFHGATEGVPGVSIDRYGAHLLFQTWRRDLLQVEQVEHMTTQISEWCGQQLKGVWNQRHKRGQVFEGTTAAVEEDNIGSELGLQYDVCLRHAGIDPLLFLDFRAARRWVLANAKSKRVLNLFSYTCGIGVAALAGGAKKVLNVDFSARSLAIGQKNAELNGLSLSKFKCLQEDVFPVIRQLSGLGVKGRAARRRYTRVHKAVFDLVVLDPPRLAKSPFGKVDLVNDYAALFKPVVLCVAEGGRAVVTNNVASVEEAVWHDQLFRCARKAGRPFQSLTALRPEVDFPSPDSSWPLKMAIIEW